MALSNDHNPDRPGELERIESSGGFVSPPPEEGLSARVWLDQEMTRIGLVRLAKWNDWLTWCLDWLLMKASTWGSETGRRVPFAVLLILTSEAI